MEIKNKKVKWGLRKNYYESHCICMRFEKQEVMLNCVEFLAVAVGVNPKHSQCTTMKI